jgi:hypothetical protein
MRSVVPIDPIADMLERIRRAVSSKRARVDIPASRLKIEIARILQAEGYIQKYTVVEESPEPGEKPQRLVRVFLKAGQQSGISARGGAQPRGEYVQVLPNITWYDEDVGSRPFKIVAAPPQLTQAEIVRKYRLTEEAERNVASFVGSIKSVRAEHVKTAAGARRPGGEKRTARSKRAK